MTTMEALRDRILHDKARSAVHTEMFDKKLQQEKKRHAERMSNLKGTLRKHIDVRWVSPEEYFEGELWVGRLQYTELKLDDFPPCKCSKTSEQHSAMTDKEYWTHRREINRYRRTLMNQRAKRMLGEHTCPWKIVGSSI